MSSAKSDRPIIIGGGIAGLLTALHLAPLPVLVLTKSALGAECSSTWAQGGLAASIASEDSVEQHVVDTIKAGAGLCDEVITRKILEAAPGAVNDLVKFGVRFNRSETGELRLHLEAAHSQRRIVHAVGGATGQEIMRALMQAVRADHEAKRAVSAT